MAEPTEQDWGRARRWLSTVRETRNSQWLDTLKNMDLNLDVADVYSCIVGIDSPPQERPRLEERL